MSENDGLLLFEAINNLKPPINVCTLCGTKYVKAKKLLASNVWKKQQQWNFHRTGSQYNTGLISNLVNY